MKKPRFSFYWTGVEGSPPIPMFAMWVEDAKGFSHVSPETLINNGHRVPKHPEHKEWEYLVRSKQKCGRCFRTLKHDLEHHNRTNHGGSAPYFPPQEKSTTAVRFIGYVEYEKTHHHAEFEIIGHKTFPDGSQVNWDTLKMIGAPIPPFPDFYTWTRARFKRRMDNIKFLRTISPAK